MSETSETSDQEKVEADDVRAVGRGAFYLTCTKLWFLLSGYVIYFALPRMLGPGDVGKTFYGKYMIITGFGAILNALVIQGTTQAVARFVGRDPKNADGVRRAAFKLQACLGGGLFLLLQATADLTAKHLYDDPSLAAPLRYASFILLFYAFYAISMGFLNGRRLFGRQALVDFCYSTLKIVGVLAGAFLFMRGAMTEVPSDRVEVSVEDGRVLAMCTADRSVGDCLELVGTNAAGETVQAVGIVRSRSGSIELTKAAADDGKWDPNTWADMKIALYNGGAISGPVGGFAVAAFLVMLVAFLLSGRPKGPGSLSVRELLGFQAFTMLFTFVATGVARGDLQVLKILLKGESGVDRLAAEYAAAQAFATIPYQAVFAITFILFPLVSGAAGRDSARMKTYILQTTRYSGIIAALVASLFVACPSRTITVLFPDNYAPAAASLQILALGYFCYSLFFIMCAIITAGGSPWVSLKLVLVAFVVQIGVGASLAQSMGGVGVAIGTAAGMASALICAHIHLKRAWGQGLAIPTVMRTILTGLVAGLMAHFLLAKARMGGGSGPLAALAEGGVAEKLVTVAGFGAVSIVFVILLFVFRVLTSEDRSRFAQILKR